MLRSAVHLRRGAPRPAFGNAPLDIRWLQRALNRILGLRLAEDGILGPQTGSALHSFQRGLGLPATGALNPRTRQALTVLARRAPIASLRAAAGRATIEQEILWERRNPAGKIAIASAGGLTVLILWNFAVGSAQLKPEHERELRRIFSRGNVGDFLVISGHTSETGNPRRNQAVSEARASAVFNQLRRQGTPGANMLAEGLGASRPRVPNTTPENLAMNRRVELQGAVLT